VILVDANILMYAAGAAHPNREKCLAFLEDVSRGKVAATIDAETLQEVLHRYRAVNRWDVGSAVYEQALTVFPDVLAITREVTDEAKGMMDRDAGLGARDAIHAAVMRVYRLSSICSYDRDFDRVPRLTRIEP
jgi:predicted nucleic acid-binding protein